MFALLMTQLLRNTFVLFLIIGLLPLYILLVVGGIFAFRGNPFFVQQRSGLNEKIFMIFKFKTMKHDTTTSYGTFLRKYSLDELPQLFNILNGDMNIIGPRPLLPSYSPLYSTFQKIRFSIKPGITGWAQVNGRNTISWEEKFNLDCWYVHNKSWKIDIKILIKTFQLFFNSSKQMTEPSKIFEGNN